jgi:hypothetical protein
MGLGKQDCVNGVDNKSMPKDIDICRMLINYYKKLAKVNNTI